MLIWAIIILLVVFYVIGRNTTDNKPPNRPKATGRPPTIIRRKQNRPKVTGISPKHSGVPLSVRIKKLYDPADYTVTSSTQQKQFISDVNSYQRTRTKTLRPIQSSSSTEIISFDFSWSDNLPELMKVSEVLYSNAQMNSNKRLESERFQYYIGLHFRSFTAADLCHEKIQEIRSTCYDHINLTLKRLQTKSDPLKVSSEDYNQIVRIKDSIKALIAFLEKRRDGLNAQTAVLRDKIRDECGIGGRKWYDSLKERSSR